MNVSDSHRHYTPAQRKRMKAQVLQALARLRDRFPLQARIETAPEPVRAEYGRILRQWRDGESPPQAARCDPELLEALVNLDAVVVQGEGLGCYPFSAEATTFVVRGTEGETKVHAFCAFDALAIPRLLGRHCRIESACASCGRGRYFEVHGNGGLSEQAVHDTVVVWAQDHGAGSPAGSCRSLCPNIRFLCSSCGGWSRNTVLTLAQATAVANAFFAFQLRLAGADGSVAIEGAGS